MSAKREQILVALLAVLVAADDGMARNSALGIVKDGLFRTLRDGEIEQTDEFFNGPGSIYEFTMSPNIILVVEKGGAADLDAAMAARIAVLTAALEAVTDLGGLITALRVQPADYAPKELFGTEDKKGAEIAIEIDFWSEHSSG